MASVIFVCTANRYRSPIAAACFNDELRKRHPGENWIVLSAGTWTVDDLAPMPEAIQTAKNIGIDIREHRSRAITPELLEGADLILTMEQGQKEALQNEFRSASRKIFLFTEVAGEKPYDIPDPMKDPTHTDVAALICDLIRTGFDKICAAALAGRHKT